MARRRFEIFVDGLTEPFQVIADPSEADLIDARDRALKNCGKMRGSCAAVCRFRTISTPICPPISDLTCIVRRVF